MSVPTAPLTGAGHAPDVWRDRIAATGRVSVDDLRALVPGRDRLVVLPAHPDDETIGAGRLLSAWSDPQTDVGGRLVTVAVGEPDDDARDASMRCFPTQVAPVRPGWGAVIPPELLALHDRQLLVLPGDEAS